MKNSTISTLHRILTDDGWEIALHRYPHPSKKRSPVLLVHGLGSNRHNMDFPEEEKSLAKFLWKEGWDTWIVELRGAGHSAKPKAWEWRQKRWNFDHYTLLDIPTAIRFILKRTRKPNLHWIGHSMGGFLAFSYLKTHTRHLLKSIVAAGTPLTIDIQPGYFRWTSYLERLLKVFPLMPYRSLAKILEIYGKWIYESELATLFVKENMDLKTLKIGAKVAIDDVSADVFFQVHNWFREKALRSMDGTISYDLEPKKIKTPLMMLIGSRDPFTTAPAVKKVFERLACKKKKWVTLGKGHGQACDYGHLDLIIGKNASREVYPLISAWLQENEAPSSRSRRVK